MFGGKKTMAPAGKGDLEYGGGGGGGGGVSNGQLYPMMMEDPQLRWGFIRKVYVILSMQLLLTASIAAVMVFVHPVARYIVSTKLGIAIYIVMIILPFILLCPLSVYHKRHPINLILLGLFTITLAFSVGMTCAFAKGKIILEAAILTSVVVVGLTLYTFWAVKRGHDFNFLGPFLFASLLMLMVFGLIQVFFPLGKLSLMIYAGLGAVIFCGYIVYDTNNLIKRFDYDDYVWAAISLYLDIINLFVLLLTLLEGADS